MKEKDLRKQCENFVKKIRNKYHLKGAEIKVTIEHLPNFSMVAKRVGNRKYKIILNYIRLKTASTKEISGAIAHELIHFEQFEKRNFLERWIHKVLYHLSRKYRAKIERTTDIETIKKGFGKELLSSTLRFERLSTPEYLKMHKWIYLSSKEIKNEMKKLRQT